MSQSEFDKILREAAQTGDFQMQDAHLNQAMDMINAKKKRRFGFFWLWAALTVIGLSGILYSTGYWGASIEDAGLALQTVEETVQNQSITSGNTNNTSSASALNKAQNAQTQATNATLNQEANNGVTKEDNKVSTTESTPAISKQTKTNNTFKSSSTINNIPVLNGRSTSQLSQIPTTMEEEKPARLLALMPIFSAERMMIEVPTLFSTNEISLITLKEESLGIKSHRIKKVHYPVIGLLFNALSSNIRYGAGIQELNLGMFWRKHWNTQWYYSIEPSVQFSLPSEDFALIQAVNNYGLEVSTEYYGIQSDLMMSGKLNVNIGWEKGRWSVQGGPTAHFLPIGYGEITQLKADDGNFVEEATLGTGWLAQDLSSPLVVGADAAVQYQVSPKMDLGFQLNYRTQGFFNKDEVRDETKSNPWAVGLRLQYRIR